jgi:RimJ/RimL family protein N-acetyltransferase
MTERGLVLTDGTHLEVNPLQATDRDAFLEGVEHLSPESRYRRFFTAAQSLNQRELTELTDLDHSSHEALAAVDPATGRGVAVARYVIVGEHPRTAEIAITVVDDWQTRGVGIALLSRLADLARSRGIERLSGLILSTNEAMIGLMRKLGPVEKLHRDGSTVELVVDIRARSS